LNSFDEIYRNWRFECREHDSNVATGNSFVFFLVVSVVSVVVVVVVGFGFFSFIVIIWEDKLMLQMPARWIHSLGRS